MRYPIYRGDQRRIQTNAADRAYLKKTTKYTDRAWAFFSLVEDDFRLLHMPLGATAADR